ncbi:MAG: nucleoside deaminase [Candidatus Dependentiae bacterium]
MLEGKGGPFGAVIVNNGKIIAVGTNQVTSLNDPTAHAEVMAIRLACQKLGTFQLLDCELYTSCEPCPMCFGAIYWARPRHIYYAATKLDAAQVGFDDSLIYQELQTPEEQRLIKTTHVTTCQPKAKELFTLWQDKKDKIVY